ncbi:MAG: hypothetical protein WA667_27115 [Candidatus Nitrosopolaris sp.]
MSTCNIIDTAATAILTALALITAGALVTPVIALKRYFNCVTELANHRCKVMLKDDDRCFHKEFHSSNRK